MSRVYLIASEERDGLVKIGFTTREGDDAVLRRVSEYATGLSDNAIVYEASGSQQFEAYLHTFFGNHQKSILVRVLSGLPGEVRAKEWFELPAEISEILKQAFESGKPARYDDLNRDDLLPFLKGALSVASFEAPLHSAQSMSPGFVPSTRPSEMPHLSSALQPALSDAQADRDEEFAMADATRHLLLMRRHEKDRRLISILGLVMMLLFVAFGTLSSGIRTGAFFSATLIGSLALLITYSWPIVQPRVVRWVATQERFFARAGKQ